MAFECPDDDMPTSPSPSMSLHFAPPEVERGKETTATITRSPADDLRVVALSASTPGLVSMPPSVTMQSGQSEASFTVGTVAGSTAGSVTIAASTTSLTATAQLFLRDPDDPVDPMRIVSAALDNDDVIGGDAVGVTVQFSRAARAGDGAFIQLYGNVYWPRRELPVPLGASSLRFLVPTPEVDEELAVDVALDYKNVSVTNVALPLTLLPRSVLWFISPTSGYQSNDVEVTLTGRHLGVGGHAVLVDGSGVTVSNVRVVDAHTLAATFSIDPSAPAGPRSVRVRTNHGTTRAVTFTVNEG